MRYRLVCLLAFAGAAGLAFPAWPESPEQKAEKLRDRYLANFSRIRTLSFTQGSAASAPGASLRAAPEAKERVLWNRERKKLKWSNPERQNAYVVDGEAMTISYCTAGGTVFRQELDAVRDAALLDPTPFPGWLWRPEWLMPGDPVEVREEGGEVVLTTSLAHPSREIRLDAATGLISGFSESDATGRVVRVVRCLSWTDHNGTWLPRTIQEEIRGRKRTVGRVISLGAAEVNLPVSESEFVLP